MKMIGEAETWPVEMGEEEVETESGGSSEAETESPRSVVRWISSPITETTKTTTAKERIHNQILKIKEEDLSFLHQPRRLNLLIISRPNLPCSPLSGKVRSVNTVQ
ncbi:unnamed protein product [Cochlearia groenlandica]